MSLLCVTHLCSYGAVTSIGAAPPPPHLCRVAPSSFASAPPEVHGDLAANLSGASMSKLGTADCAGVYRFLGARSPALLECKSLAFYLYLPRQVCVSWCPVRASVCCAGLRCVAVALQIVKVLWGIPFTPPSMLQHPFST